jgi:hypothetical protein
VHRVHREARRWVDQRCVDETLQSWLMKSSDDGRGRKLEGRRRCETGGRSSSHEVHGPRFPNIVRAGFETHGIRCKNCGRYIVRHLEHICRCCHPLVMLPGARSCRCRVPGEDVMQRDARRSGDHVMRVLLILPCLAFCGPAMAPQTGHSKYSNPCSIGKANKLFPRKT